MPGGGGDQACVTRGETTNSSTSNAARWPLRIPLPFPNGLLVSPPLHLPSRFLPGTGAAPAADGPVLPV